MLSYQGENNYLVVGVLASDGLSGREKYLRSKFYRRDDVRPRSFQSLDTDLDKELNWLRTKLKRLYDKCRPGLGLKRGEDSDIPAGY
jgi:hypothetical protein